MNFLEDEKTRERLLNDVMKTYYGYRIASDITDRGTDYFLNRGSKNLEDKERMLSIMEKKRRLGLPESDADYEQAVNEDKPFYAAAQNSVGKRVLQAIPGPNLLEHKPQGFFQIARNAADALPSMNNSMQSLHLGSNKYGGFLRTARTLLSSI